MFRTLTLLGLSLFVLTLSELATACSLWGAAGPRVVGHGVLIAKNRDTGPEPLEFVKLVEPENGFAHYGLFVVSSDPNLTFNPMKAAVNEHGLSVVYASANGIPQDERYSLPNTPKVLKYIVSQFRNVDELIRNLPNIQGPRIFIAGDRTQVVHIELGPEGQIAVTSQKNGVLLTTNSYQNLANKRIEHHDLLRLNKLKNLGHQRELFEPNDFLEIGRRLWRNEDFIQTSSTWITHVMPNGHIEILIQRKGQVPQQILWKPRTNITCASSLSATLGNSL